MTFDEDISNKVSLAKILDELIYDNSEPSVIVSFLQSHLDCIDDIIKESHYIASRILQLDFLYKCNLKEAKFLLEAFNNKNVLRLPYYLFNKQVCHSKSNISEDIKIIARKNITDIYQGNTSDPFKYFAYANLTRWMSSKDFKIETMLFDAVKDETILSFLLDLDINTFSDVIVHSTHNSFFKYRLYADDVYDALDLAKKFILIRNLLVYVTPNGFFNAFQTRNLFKHIMSSTYEDVDIKYAILKDIQDNNDSDFTLKEDPSGYWWRNDHFAKYYKIKSASQLTLQLLLDGVFDWSDVIVYHLIEKNYKILQELVKTNQAAFDTQLDCSDLINFIN